MRKLILFVGALIGLVYLINGGSGPTNSTATTSSTAIKTDLRNGILNGRQADVISLPVIQLADEYDRNEIATDLRLKGKIVEVSGTVHSITKDALGYLRVGLVTRNQYLPASMQVDKIQEATLANLRKGQPVTFRCQRMQRWVGAPFGNDCILM